MTSTRQMLRNHPHAASAHADMLADAIDAASACERACTLCADAFLAEDKPSVFVDCIRMTGDCAEVCKLAGHMLLRQTEADVDLVRRAIELCTLTCRSCADICHGHSKKAYCSVCVHCCKACADACDRVLGVLPNNSH
ncbi:MAG: four-helix bundle copper-binding protein [Phycisphaerae bacterium]|nr:four-helix bundle copper-binding protein [Phycisphaerae bacterium]